MQAVVVNSNGGYLIIVWVAISIRPDIRNSAFYLHTFLKGDFR
jgi:hypothetical protein